MVLVAVTNAQQLTDQAVQLRLGRRWPMLPSTGRKKTPCVLWKRFQTELPPADQLRQWARQFKPERWGLVTGELSEVVVADFDGELGIRLMHKWKINPHLRTPSGGFHCHLRHPGWRVPTLNAKTGKKSWPWPGLDIRGDGGFAVVVGSNTYGPYEQLRDFEPEPFDVLPKEVRTFLCNHGKGNLTQRRLITFPMTSVPADRVDPNRLIEKALARAPIDGRNNSGFWLACQLRDNGFSIEEAEPAMRDYGSRVASTNTKGKVEQYTESEITASLRQAYSQPARDPWERRKPRPQKENCRAAAPTTESDRPGTASLSQKETPQQREIADDPEYLDIHVVPTGGPVVIPPWESLSSTRFARIPEDVFADPRLDHRDVRVYSVLSFSCWPGNVSEVGNRRIAARTHSGGRFVAESLRQLERAGHIRRLSRGSGRRGRYVLLSPIFANQQSGGENGGAAYSALHNRPALPKKHPQPEVVSRPRSSYAQRKPK